MGTQQEKKTIQELRRQTINLGVQLEVYQEQHKENAARINLLNKPGDENMMNRAIQTDEEVDNSQEKLAA